MLNGPGPEQGWFLLGGGALLLILLGLLWRLFRRKPTNPPVIDPATGRGITPAGPSASSFVVNPDSLNVHIVRNTEDRVLHVEHIREFTLAVDSAAARPMAAHYVTDNIALFDGSLRLELDKPLEDTIAPEQGSELRFAAEKSIKETTVVSYAQTLHGIRVDRAGLSVVVNYHTPTQRRITSAQSSLHAIPAVLPALDEGSRVAAQTALRELKDPTVLARQLGLADGYPFRVASIHETPRLLYHRYDPADRIDRNPAPEPRTEWQPLVSAPPYLPLEQVPAEIVPGQHYLVADVLFMLVLPDAKDTRAGVNWRAFLEVRTRSVLYVRPVVADCFDTIFSPDGAEAVSPCPGDLISAEATVFTSDPMTHAGVNPFDPATAPPDPAAYEALLATFCSPVKLKNVKVTRHVQRLVGKWVTLEDTDAPPDIQEAAKPLLPAGATYQFNYPVRQKVDAFTAVNAYYHCDAMFRMVAQVGLLTDLFPTCQTIRVDHKALGGEVNARVFGTADLTATDRIYFGGARQDALTVSAIDIGNVVDIRMVLHEFCHVLLLASTHWPMLDFAHSAGDSLAAILNDPCSKLTGDARYETFPWILRENPAFDPIQGRHHGGLTQCDARGWCWGGTIDLNNHQPLNAYLGYGQEQLLSTTLFRVYQMVGGDARAAAGGDDTEFQKIRCFAARYLAYLIIRAIGALPYRDYTPTFTADAFATALMEADTGTPVFDDRVFHKIPGGTLHKVIRWSFAQQGLYQPPAAASPVTGPGRPAVDVFIGPGRANYEPYRQEFWETTDLWNRRAPDGATESGHETALAGQANSAYLRVHNGGYAPAANVQVRGYYRRMAPDLAWEDGGVWTPMTPEVLDVPGSLASNGDSDPLGPFSWTPAALQNPGEPETWCLLFSVSADGDKSNIDPTVTLPCKATRTPLWRLVPFDNNLAAREASAVVGP